MTRHRRPDLPTWPSWELFAQLALCYLAVVGVFSRWLLGVG